MIAADLAPQTLADYRKLLSSIVACQAAGGVGALATGDAEEYYRSLDRPSFSPPGWVFGPVWTALYALMGGALFLTRRAGDRGQENQTALTLFGVQLVLNALWSFLFFRLRSPGLALVEIVILWVAIVLTVRSFFRLSPLAGYLLLPYLAWTSFAVVLNLSLSRRNN